MHIAHIVLGGCLKAPTLDIGITPDTGGHLVYALGAARAMAARGAGHAVTIYTRQFDGPGATRRYRQESDILAPGCRIVRLPTATPGYLGKDRLRAEIDSFAAALSAHLARQDARPDAIHAHFADAGMVALRIRDAHPVPLIYTPHSLGLEKAGSSSTVDAEIAARIAQERRVIHEADAIVVSSRDEAERQIAAYCPAAAARTHVIPPGYEAHAGAADIEGAQGLLTPHLRDPDRPLVLAIARPVRRKNLAPLIGMFGRSPGLRARANLAILAGRRGEAGDGPSEQRAVWRDMDRAVERHALHGQIACPHTHTPAQAHGLYRIAARTGGVFVNPAGSEPFGLTIIEAAQAGLPVVVTHRGGPPETVAAIGHGSVADPADGAAFAGAIERLIDDRAAWNAASRRAVANVGRYSWATYAERFAGIVEGIRTRPARARPAQAQTLLVSDIDDTLTGDRAAAAAFCAWRAAHPDVVLAMATGRRAADALAVLDAWHLPRPDVLIGAVGTEIVWPAGHAEPAYRPALRAPWDAGAVERALAPVPGVVAQPRSERTPWKRSYTLTAPGAADRARRALEKAGIAAQVVASHDTLLDILPAGVGKAQAAHHVAARLGIPASRIVAAGDSGNDFDMLAASARAVMVGNHHDDLTPLIPAPNVYRARAHHAAGVLEGLRHFGLVREVAS